MSKKAQEFLTVPEVAEEMRVHPSTVYGWVARGVVPVVRVGRGTIRVPAEALRELTKPTKPTS